jgi:glycogen phosphorylase
MEREEPKNPAPDKRKVAYFSMEIGISSKIRTYSGGLGVLAGDTIKSAADLGVPMVAVCLLYRKGYFKQSLDHDGNQTESDMPWNPEEFMAPLEPVIKVHLSKRTVAVKAWQHDVVGCFGHIVPIIFLDADLEQNSNEDRQLTAHLYGGSHDYRLAQEVILGIGGLRMLQALGYKNISKYHMNEGHAAMLTIELAKKCKDLECLRERCVFTTHTPVPAGHDQFDLDTVRRIKPDFPFDNHNAGLHDGKLNMTLLALNHSRYVNGVAKKHGEVSRKMFPSYPVDSITNGVHPATWTSKHIQDVLDTYCAGWKSDSFLIRNVFKADYKTIIDAHLAAKKELVEYINGLDSRTSDFDEHTITLGFARRATAYKRADLLLFDTQRLNHIGDKVGGIQIVYSGKAHPHDTTGKDLIRAIYRKRHDLKGRVRLVYIPNYDMDIALKLISGVDVWINTPQPPNEASGTSGMKAALNGIPSLSVPDGWWIEGSIEGKTGWDIGNGNESYEESAQIIYDRLEKDILPLYYFDKNAWARIMRACIGINGSYFHTHRMLLEYVNNAYL